MHQVRILIAALSVGLVARFGGDEPVFASSLGAGKTQDFGIAIPFCTAAKARSKPGIDRSMESNGTVSDRRKYPLRPKPVPGTASTPSAASRRINSMSSGIGVL